MEKQKEERTIAVLGTFGGEEHECRECGNTVEYMDEYCKWCGKKLDWSEEELHQHILNTPSTASGSITKSPADVTASYIIVRIGTTTMQAEKTAKYGM